VILISRYDFILVVGSMTKKNEVLGKIPERNDFQYRYSYFFSATIMARHTTTHLLV
jgi:hypothetical protein